MNQSRNPHIRRLAVALSILAAGCSSEKIFVDERAESNLPPRLVEYGPSDTTPEVVLGEQIEFFVRAADPDGDDLFFEFCVDDTVVSKASTYAHVGRIQGATRAVRATVTDGTLSVAREWSLKVIGPPDSVAPAPVEITAVERGPNPHEIEIRWLAVGDNGMEGRATTYAIGVSDFPIETESAWDHARLFRVDGSATDPGTEMSQILSLSMAGHLTVAAIRAIDDKGNRSPLGDDAEGFTRGYSYSGEVRDVMTDVPIEGIIITSSAYEVLTDQNGLWSVTEVPNLSGLVVTDDGIQGPIGEYYDYLISEPNVQNGHHLVYLFPNINLESDRYTGFLSFFVTMTELDGVPYPSYLRHWELPVEIYVPPFENEGLDYKATVERVVVDLENDIGFQVFRTVDAPSGVGVVCEFRNNITADNYRTIEWTGDWYPLRGKVEFRTSYSPSSLAAFERVIRHEMGHVLGLSHSTDPNHLMVGGQTQLVDTFTPDEVAVLQIIYGSSGNIAMGSYRED